VFREVHRVLRDDGTLWLNLGDTYAGYWGNRYAHKPFGKDRTPDSSTPPNKPSLDFRRLPIKPKDLIGVPWRVALALQVDGWYLRSDVIWSKRNSRPESVTDRPTRTHEYVFLLSKSRRYFYDADAIKEPLAKCNAQRTTSHYGTAERYGAGNGGNGGLDALAARMRAGQHVRRNRRSVWTLSTRPYRGAHFAVFPPELVEPCIQAGTSERGCCETCGTPWRRTKQPERSLTGWEQGCKCEQHTPVACTVLDPFLGSGTTAAVAEQLGCRCIGIELNEKYCRLAADRFRQGTFLTNVTRLSTGERASLAEAPHMPNRTEAV
jgi:DNA modification methylase